MLTRVERRSSGPTGDSGEGGATGSKTGRLYAGDRTGDELLERQPMLKNPPQRQNREGEKDQ